MANNFQIKHFDDLKEMLSLFSSNKNDTELLDALENAMLINGLDLFTFYPPKYHNANKKALLDDVIERQKYKPSTRELLITRFYPKKLPTVCSFGNFDDMIKRHSFIPKVFDYTSTNEENIIEWHMNFANCDIFAFYTGFLLAQDELQVLECPQLASLREYLTNQKKDPTNDKQLFNPFVVQNNEPHPILISNIERPINLDTQNLYGHNFAQSSKETILKSYEYLDPPQTINIIAIEAPKYGQGRYTFQQIEYILQECYTAYLSAKSLSSLIYRLNNSKSATKPIETFIHTGWFGCGTYGGNRIIMIVLQVLAAEMAGIDKIIFHTVTNLYNEDINAADLFLKKIFHKCQSQLSIEELINTIVNENFQWGFSNGT